MTYIEEYYNKIISGEIVACKRIKQIYKKLVDDLNNPKDNWIFDEELANKPIEFIETFCKQAQGAMGETLKLELEHEEYQTIAGYVLDMLDHIPETNERFILKGYRGRIMKVEDRRIVEIEFTPLKYTRGNDNIDNTENNEQIDMHDMEKNDLEIANE